MVVCTRLGLGLPRGRTIQRILEHSAPTIARSILVGPTPTTARSSVPKAPPGPPPDHFLDEVRAQDDDVVELGEEFGDVFSNHPQDSGFKRCTVADVLFSRESMKCEFIDGQKLEDLVLHLERREVSTEDKFLWLDAVQKVSRSS